MTIEEIKKLKTDFEDKISLALKDLEKATDMEVTYVAVQSESKKVTITLSLE